MRSMESDFKILVVDDEVIIAEYLKDILVSFGYSNIVLAHNKVKALKQMEEFSPDLVLLDIRMKSEFEGIEIASEISENYNTPYLFITAHSDTQIIEKALKTKPAGYITKPFKEIDVYAAVHLIETNSEVIAEKHILIKDGYAYVKVLIEDVLYAESDNNYLHIYTIQKKYTLRATLDWFKNETRFYSFHQTHRSFIVNKTKVTKYDSKCLEIGGVKIPISRGNQLSF
jgi:two-component system response regulator LytT